MAEKPRSRAKTPRKQPSAFGAFLRVWGPRLGIALAAGLVLGAAAGVKVVDRFDPGRPGGIDSLRIRSGSRGKAVDTQLNDDLNSARAGNSNAAPGRAGGASGNAASETDTDTDTGADADIYADTHADVASNADSAEQAARPVVAAVDSTTDRITHQIAIPILVNLQEGDARSALRRAGFEIGEVKFRSSALPAGTVLATEPAAGSLRDPGSTVNLILSDGRREADSTGFSSSPFP